jgi:hypothetical protein
MFMLKCDRSGFHKKRALTRYTELVFLHPVGSTGHTVHCHVSGPRNIDALFFILRWDRYGFDKKCVGTCYVELLFLAYGGIYG